jgi:2-polyprenyl-3-methyl-5-hydroxy-6-metoxy-1,4-benzoquinol methylase
MRQAERADTAVEKITQSCPVCKKEGARVSGIYSAMLALPGNSESRVVQCSSCRVLYLSPYISNDLLSAMYSRSYFTAESNGDNQGIGVPGSNSDYEREFVTARLGKFRKTVQALKRNVPEATTILDIGAATGDFLAIARDEGLVPSGVELSSYAAAKAREKYGLEFFEGTVQDYRTEMKFDIIHMNHVFEHFPYPCEVLEAAQSLLSKRGVIYVEVPFQFNIVEVLKYQVTGKPKAFDIFSLHHPVFYRPKTLEALFNRHGFDSLSMKVFDWSRYEAESLAAHIKRLTWLGLSVMGQGLMIEAVFKRKRD